MGHKGVSKRKPKKNKSFSDDNLNNASNTRPGQSLSVQSLVKDAHLNRGGMNPSAGPNKKSRKGKQAFGQSNGVDRF